MYYSFYKRGQPQSVFLSDRKPLLTTITHESQNIYKRVQTNDTFSAILHKSQKNKHQHRNISKPRHDTRILCINYSFYKRVQTNDTFEAILYKSQMNKHQHRNIKQTQA